MHSIACVSYDAPPSYRNGEDCLGRVTPRLASPLPQQILLFSDTTWNSIVRFGSVFEQMRSFYVSIIAIERLCRRRL